MNKTHFDSVVRNYLGTENLVGISHSATLIYVETWARSISGSILKKIERYGEANLSEVVKSGLGLTLIFEPKAGRWRDANV